MSSEVEPRFFVSAADFRRWLQQNHAKVDVLWIGFWKKASGRGGLTYDEAVDQSLCFGWIDGLKKAHDAASFKQRFTPRRPRSIWSAINIRKVESLKKRGLMAEPGLAAFALRGAKRSSVYSFENRDMTLDPAFARRLKANARALAFFASQPPGYRRLATHWVMSAKREETRERRFAKLVEDSARGERIAPILGKPAKRGSH